MIAPQRPDLDAAVDQMAAMVRPILSEPAEIYRAGPMWEGEGWALEIKLVTDHQLAALMKRDDILASIEAIAADVPSGSRAAEEFQGIFIYTQEYVDREYAGNWFGAHHNGGKAWKRRP